MCENLHYESVYFRELHNEQEYYWPTIYRAGAAVVSTITSSKYNLRGVKKLIVPKVATTTFGLNIYFHLELSARWNKKRSRSLILSNYV